MFQAAILLSSFSFYVICPEYHALTEPESILPESMMLQVVIMNINIIIELKLY